MNIFSFIMRKVFKKVVISTKFIRNEHISFKAKGFMVFFNSFNHTPVDMLAFLKLRFLQEKKIRNIKSFEETELSKIFEEIQKSVSTKDFTITEKSVLEEFKKVAKEIFQIEV